ncbi:hypothetical protein [Nocardia sp. NPDC051570]|uniref:restriction system modified-DNA reader domain-containing protein n=1 Tax=Nocardia sp. NPDC051570 TaxID=3364324 RepID=UPI00379A4507
MALRKIDVDDDVFAYLADAAEPFVETTPNDVLRRILLPDKAAGSPSGTTGMLTPLISEGKLNPGDRLVHHQPRKQRTFHATVASDGFIELDNGLRFAAPSPALRECVGNQINGWENWVVERINRPLGDLRA